MLTGVVLAFALSILGPSAAASPASPGLSATLAFDRTTLPMGEAVSVRLLLDADSSLAGSGSILNHNDGAWTCSLVFHNVASGAEYHRPPFDAGMPPTLGRERFILLGNGVIEEEVRVYLLSRDGEQIPPGRYRVHANYENFGNSTAFEHPDTATTPDVHPNPSRLWAGAIASAPVTIEIETAAPETIELSVPQRVTYKLLMDVSQIAVYWDEHSAQSTEVTRRPGYTVGHRYQVTVMVDGVESEYHPSGLGGAGWATSGTALMLPQDISKRVFTGSDLELVIDMEVFETSAPAVHGWLPEHGDIRVLWRGTIRASYR